MATAAALQSKPTYVSKAKVYLLGRQALVSQELERFLNDEGALFTTDTEQAAEVLAEIAGRTCYMSFGKGRKSNQEYLENILSSKHGSVLEHAVFNLLITGVSRSLTHELVRHRAGFGFSQISQRFVDESECDFVEPGVIAEDPELHRIWLAAVRASQAAYRELADRLAEKLKGLGDRTSRRKKAREAARSVLPNATETKIFVTANARALRHFVEMRGDAAADVEIRRLALAILKLLQADSPNLFGDYAIVDLPEGGQAAATSHRKV